MPASAAGLHLGASAQDSSQAPPCSKTLVWAVHGCWDGHGHRLASSRASSSALRLPVRFLRSPVLSRPPFVPCSTQQVRQPASAVILWPQGKACGRGEPDLLVRARPLSRVKLLNQAGSGMVDVIA